MIDATRMRFGCACLIREIRGIHQSSGLSEMSSQFHDEWSAVPGRFCIESCGESGVARRNLVFGPATLMTGWSPIVLVTTPPQPASNARMMLPSDSVGGADASRNGFSKSMPVNRVARVVFIGCSRGGPDHSTGGLRPGPLPLPLPFALCPLPLPSALAAKSPCGVQSGHTMSLLNKNGRVITASDDYVADVYCEDGTVGAIGRNLPLERYRADRTLDASGQYVMPGGIDVHTHLDMPFGGTTSADDFESGTIAAAFGGTTSLVDFAIQYRGKTMRHALDDWMAKASGKAAIDYSFHMIVTELPDAGLSDMDRLVRDEGVTSFKLFMAYPGVFMVDDATIFRALRKTGENGGLVCMHAENGGVIDLLVQEALRKGQKAPKYHALTRPPRLESEATGRAIALAEIAGVPIYIVHLSSADALQKVREARDMGLPAYAETCPQYLFLSYDNYEEPGFDGAKYVMSPPLREKWHQDVLWKGLEKNDLQVISTDHCPFCMSEQKELGKDDFSKIPNGAPGIETRLTLVHDGGVRPGRISMNRFVELCSTTPARMFGLFPRKGTIAVGSDADIVIFDPNKKATLSVKTLHMKVDYNPYEGRVVQGSPSTVISN